MQSIFSKLFEPSQSMKVPLLDKEDKLDLAERGFSDYCSVSLVANKAVNMVKIKPKHAPKSSLEMLPEDLLSYLCNFMGPNDRAQLAQTSMKLLKNDDDFWNLHVISDLKRIFDDRSSRNLGCALTITAFGIPLVSGIIAFTMAILSFVPPCDQSWQLAPSECEAYSYTLFTFLSAAIISGLIVKNCAVPNCDRNFIISQLGEEIQEKLALYYKIFPKDKLNDIKDQPVSSSKLIDIFSESLDTIKYFIENTDKIRHEKYPYKSNRFFSQAPGERLRLKSTDDQLSSAARAAMP